jgi:hypothetical protein
MRSAAHDITADILNIPGSVEHEIVDTRTSKKTPEGDFSFAHTHFFFDFMLQILMRAYEIFLVLV